MTIMKENGMVWGGKFDAGESPEDCVIREVKEESGLDIKNPKMNGFITFPMFDGVDDWYVFIFTANVYSGNLIDSREGKLEWIPNDRLLDLNLWDGDKIFIKWLLQEKFFSAKFIYESGSYKEHEVIFY